MKKSLTLLSLSAFVLIVIAEEAHARITCSPTQTCGQVIARSEHGGVEVFSNSPFQANPTDCDPGTFPFGEHYQCVEFIRRFYSQALNVDTSAWKGNAVDYYSNVDPAHLDRFSNRQTLVPPAADDILVFGSTIQDRFGHVAIVTGASSGKVNLIEQNWSCDGKGDNRIALTLSQDPTSGYWQVAPRGDFAVLGWLRRKGSSAPALSFSSKFDLMTGTEPLGLAVADFDGDGRTDIAVTIYNNGNGDHLTVFRNTGTVGHLQFDPLPIDVPTGSGPEGIAVGDLNNDNKVDLVTVNPGNSSISVLRNFSTNGFIDFEPVALSLSAPPTPHRVVIADFDGDGRPDLIVTSNSGRLVSVFHHGSDPNVISFDYRRDFSAGDFLSDVAVADIDHDTRPEILVTLSDGLKVFQNQSTQGNVQATGLTTLAAGTVPRGIAAGDLNNDQLPDVLVAAIGGVGVFQNHSSPGMFDLRRTDLLTGTNPDAVAIGDLDKDGFLDAVVANPSDNTLTVLHNTTGNMGAPIALTALQTPLATGLNPFSLVLGDVDGDGWPDIVSANIDANTISIILNTTGHQ